MKVKIHTRAAYMLHVKFIKCARTGLLNHRLSSNFVTYSDGIVLKVAINRLIIDAAIYALKAVGKCVSQIDLFEIYNLICGN